VVGEGDLCQWKCRVRLHGGKSKVGSTRISSGVFLEVVFVVGSEYVRGEEFQ